MQQIVFELYYLTLRLWLNRLSHLVIRFPKLALFSRELNLLWLSSFLAIDILIEKMQGLIKERQLLQKLFNAFNFPFSFYDGHRRIHQNLWFLKNARKCFPECIGWNWSKMTLFLSYYYAFRYGKRLLPCKPNLN